MKEKMQMIIEGYAIVYNQKTILYENDGLKYYEVISPKALDGADLSDVMLKYNHSDEVFVLAGVKNDSLQLINTPKGLKVRAELANTTAGRDLYELISTQLVNKMSFAFTISTDKYDIENRTRTIEKIKKLWDCAVVPVPAYPQTSVKVVTDESTIRLFKRTRLESGIERVLSLWIWNI